MKIMIMPQQINPPNENPPVVDPPDELPAFAGAFPLFLIVAMYASMVSEMPLP